MFFVGTRALHTTKEVKNVRQHGFTVASSDSETRRSLEGGVGVSRNGSRRGTETAALTLCPAAWGEALQCAAKIT